MFDDGDDLRAGDLERRLRRYGQWLDSASNEYLRVKESEVSSSVDGGFMRRRRANRVLTAVAATVLILAGSFVVNQVGGQNNSSSVAFAWNAKPADVSEVQRQAVVDACNQANPVSANIAAVQTALDIRGTLGIEVWVFDSKVDVCLVSLGHDQPSARIVPGLSLESNSDVPGVQILNMSFESREISVVVGRDNALPKDCRNLDVFTSKGVIRAVRASGIFAFWYPGAPAIGGRNPNSIQYGCAADSSNSGSVVTQHSIASADPFANLCISTFQVLMDHGIVNQTGRVIDLDKWDISVYDEFKNTLTPIATAFSQNDEVFKMFREVNTGGMLALDASGAQKLTAKERYDIELKVAKAINSFSTLCESSRTRPEERRNPMTETTIEVHEMQPASPTTMLQLREMTPAVASTVAPPG